MTTLQIPATAATSPKTPLRRRISAGQALAHSLTLAWRNVIQLKHSPEKLLDVILMPIVFLVLFLFVFGGAVAGSTHAYLELLLPGLVAQMAVFATMGLGTALCEDIHKGVFDRFRSLPIARSAPLVGAVLGDTVRVCVVMVVLTGFGSLLGFRFHTGVLAVLAAFTPGLGVLPGGVLALGAHRAGRAVPGDRAGDRVHLHHAAGVRQQHPAAQDTYSRQAGCRPGSRSTRSPPWRTRCAA